MHKEIVRTHLWQDIIRLGFSPSGAKNQSNWIVQYGKSLKEFWELESYPQPPSKHGKEISATIDSLAVISISYEYTIESFDKFSVRLMYSPPFHGKHIMWIHDVDDREGRYFKLPVQLLLNDRKEKRFFLRDMKLDDLEAVIDSLIIHPTPHQHLESPIDNHEIRIGGGILNPFLYLFHLRVQLCPDKDRRVRERIRLIDLFKKAVSGNSEISPNELMKIPK